MLQSTLLFIIIEYIFVKQPKLLTGFLMLNLLKMMSGTLYD